MSGSVLPLRVLVADDESPARARLRQLCDGLPGVEVVGEAGDGAAALELCRVLAPEVVLMDIRMPGMDGLAAAREVACLPLPPAVVFVTAYDQHALEAFESAASAYLLKPVRREKLAAALERARRPTRAQVQRLGNPAPEATTALPPLVVRRLTPQGLQWQRIPVESILACIADRKYVVLHTTGGDYLTETPLKELEEAHAGRWLRVHRNALVTLAQVTQATRTADGGLELALRGSSRRITASRRLAPEVLRRLGAAAGVCETRPP